MIKTTITVETVGGTNPEEPEKYKSVETVGTTSPGDMDVEEDVKTHTEAVIGLTAMVERAVQVNLERIAEMVEQTEQANLEHAAKIEGEKPKPDSEKGETTGGQA